MVSEKMIIVFPHVLPKLITEHIVHIINPEILHIDNLATFLWRYSFLESINWSYNCGWEEMRLKGVVNNEQYSSITTQSIYHQAGVALDSNISCFKHSLPKVFLHFKYLSTVRFLLVLKPWVLLDTIQVR